VNLAQQIQAQELLEAQERLEAQELQQQSVNEFVPKELNLFQSIRADDEWIVISFVLKLFGLVAILLCIVGGIVVWNIVESNRQIDPCLREVIGDGVCDDQQNTLECEYDGMDCCLVSVARITKYCDDCKCHLGKCSK
jgi:hypothetical protein